MKDFYNVLQTDDYETVFKYLEEYNIEAVLMDINLGRFYNGLDLFNDIRQLDNYKEVPIIAVTGYASSFDREKIMNNGFSNYLTKPFEKKQLLDIINS